MEVGKRGPADAGWLLACHRGQALLGPELLGHPAAAGPRRRHCLFHAQPAPTVCALLRRFWYVFRSFSLSLSLYVCV